MNIRKIVGINLKYLRYKSGMSQEEYYSSHNLNTKYMAGIERGSINFKIDYLEHIAKKLNVNAKELLEFDENHIIIKKRIDEKTKAS